MVTIQFADAVAITAGAISDSFPDGVTAPSGFLFLLLLFGVLCFSFHTLGFWFNMFGYY